MGMKRNFWRYTDTSEVCASRHLTPVFPLPSASAIDLDKQSNYEGDVRTNNIALGVRSTPAHIIGNDRSVTAPKHNRTFRINLAKRKSEQPPSGVLEVKVNSG